LCKTWQQQPQELTLQTVQMQVLVLLQAQMLVLQVQMTAVLT
jgi:hypothetical protein